MVRGISKMKSLNEPLKEILWIHFTFFANFDKWAFRIMWSKKNNRHSRRHYWKSDLNLEKWGLQWNFEVKLYFEKTQEHEKRTRLLAPEKRRYIKAKVDGKRTIWSGHTSFRFRRCGNGEKGREKKRKEDEKEEVRGGGMHVGENWEADWQSQLCSHHISAILIYRALKLKSSKFKPNTHARWLGHRVEWSTPLQIRLGDRV